MADSDPPRFFKVFVSRYSSDSMQIPISYYDQIPRLLPKTVTLQGTGGCIWEVTMKQKGDEVHFEQGWTKFVADNSLADGDFMTFVYNGDCIFEVAIYDGRNSCKAIRATTDEVEEDKEDSVCTLSGKDTGSGSESETANAIVRYKNKGKMKVVEDSSDEEDSVEDTDDTCSENKMVKIIPSSKNRGKKKVKALEDSDEGDDSDDDDYVEAFGELDFEENSNSDSSYDPDSEDSANSVKAKPKMTNPKKKKGKSKSREDVDASSDSPGSEEPKEKRGRVIPRIKYPERYLDDPKNVHFETAMKNRMYELLVHAQIVKDYGLKFKPHVHYIDNHKDGKLQAKATTWSDTRVCIKKWKRICQRNKVNKKDAILCELFRRHGRGVVYAVKVHIVREKGL